MPPTLTNYLPGMRVRVTQQIPFGKAAVLREGTDATVVALAQMVYRTLEAASVLAETDFGIGPQALLAPAALAAGTPAWG